jgi:hypothetical protein
VPADDTPMPPFDDDVVSPELALVDPELAARARATLEPLRASAPPIRVVRIAAPPPDTPPRGRRVELSALGIAVGLTLLGAGMFDSVRSAGAVDATASAQPTMYFHRSVPAASDASASAATAVDPAPSGDGGAPSPAFSSVILRGSGAPDGSKASASDVRDLAATTSAANSATVSNPPTLRWKTNVRAHAYDLVLARGGSVIYSTRLRPAEVGLPRSWWRGGVTYTIEPEDRAYVWPILEGRRSTQPLVNGARAGDVRLVVRLGELSRSATQP